MQRRIIKLPNEVTGELEECWYSEKLGRTVLVGSDEERRLLEEEEGRESVPEAAESVPDDLSESMGKAGHRGRKMKAGTAKKKISHTYIRTDVLVSLRSLTNLIAYKEGRSVSIVDYLSDAVEAKVRKDLSKYRL